MSAASHQWPGAIAHNKECKHSQLSTEPDKLSEILHQWPGVFAQTKERFKWKCRTACALCPCTSMSKTSLHCMHCSSLHFQTTPYASEHCVSFFHFMFAGRQTSGSQSIQSECRGLKSLEASRPSDSVCSTQVCSLETCASQRHLCIPHCIKTCDTGVQLRDAHTSHTALNVWRRCAAQRRSHIPHCIKTCDTCVQRRDCYASHTVLKRVKQVCSS